MTLKALWAHGRRHVEMDGEFAKIENRCAVEKGAMDEAKIERERIARSLALALTALRELLVHEGLRPPGQGINGEPED